MDEVNDMNESRGLVEQALAAPLRRRDFLTKAAAAGTIAWATPVILSRPAYAADGTGGTPGCQPTFTFTCVVYDCQQGGKMFPGFTVNTTACPCSTTHKTPTTCIKITNLAATCTTTPVAYGNGTLCAPSGTDTILSTGNWTCFNPSQPVFFARPRAGSIPALPSDCTFTFRVGVWAGNCPDRANPTEAFSCQTYNATIVWNQGTKTVSSCTFQQAPAAQSLCTTTPANVSPCGTC